MKNTTNKILAVALAVTLLALAVVAGTLAYLTKETVAIKNVFTKGTGVNITLREVYDLNFGTTASAEVTVEMTPDSTEDESVPMTFDPGKIYLKDVTIENTSAEKGVFVFLKVTMGAKVADLFTYEINSSWKCIDAENGIYAYVKGAESEGMPGVLATAEAVDETDSFFVEGKITCNEMSSEELEELVINGGEATISFQAYAVQADIPPEELEALGDALGIFQDSFGSND